MAEISIQAMIDTAIAQGRRSVEVPEGTYRFSERLLLRDAHDLVLDGHGATFIFAERRSAGISVENCHGFTLRNLTIDHDPVPFTQGAVTDIDPAGTWLDVAIDRGYDMTVETFQQNRAMHHFDAATLGFKHDGAWMGPKSVTSPRPGVFRAGFLDSVHSSRYNVETGDLFAFTAERPSHAIALVESWETRVEDILFSAARGPESWKWAEGERVCAIGSCPGRALWGRRGTVCFLRAPTASGVSARRSARSWTVVRWSTWATPE